MDNDFWKFTRTILNYYQWIGVSRYCINCGVTSSGSLVTMETSLLPRLTYYGYYVNSTVKLSYLLCVLLGIVGDSITFLEWIANLDYFLCGILILFGTLIWNRAMFDSVCQLWEIEGKVYERIVKFYPTHALSTKDISSRHKVTLLVNSLVVLLGCASLCIQFYTEPKHISFTYSLIKADNPFLRVLFCAHEVIFMGHAWFCNAGTSVIITFVSDGLSMTLKMLAGITQEIGKRERLKKNYNILMGAIPLHPRNIPMEPETKVILSPILSGLGLREVHYEVPPTSSCWGLPRRRPNRRLKFKPGSYNVNLLLSDLKKLSLATRIFNDEVAYKLGGLILTGYCQYVASTCMAFQVIRTLHGEIGDIWFYLQDCIVSGYHTFRVFEHASEVLPLVEQVFSNIKKNEASSPKKMTKLQQLQFRSQSKIAMKVGPVQLNKMSVLHSMQSLMGYYLCVALW